MMNPATLARIRALHGQGLSQRQIARAVDVSRRTVANHLAEPAVIPAFEDQVAADAAAGARPAHGWDLRAACATADADADVFFDATQGRHTDLAATAQVCSPCPVRRDCLLHALTAWEEHGVWAGTTPPRRRSLRRAHAITGSRR